ncbi:21686_t:CDS:2, partial [Racocetra persica]
MTNHLTHISIQQFEIIINLLDENGDIVDDELTEVENKYKNYSKLIEDNSDLIIDNKIDQSKIDKLKEAEEDALNAIELLD